MALGDLLSKCAVPNDIFRPVSAPSWAVRFPLTLRRLSLVGPAMSDAITNLGGGGLSTPWLANLSSCLNYVCGFLCTLFGGPLINKIGIKWSCFIAALAFPLQGSSYFVNAKYGVDWYLLFANVSLAEHIIHASVADNMKIIGGFASGFLYVAETTAMLSYPNPEDRGFYLGQ